MILDDNDKRAIKIISGISRYDEKTVMDIFRAVMQMAVIEIEYKKGTIEPDINKECVVTIPGVCDLNMDYYDQVMGSKKMTNIEFNASPKKAIIAEINAYMAGEESPDLRKIKSEIQDTFKLTVDIE